MKMEMQEHTPEKTWTKNMEKHTSGNRFMEIRPWKQIVKEKHQETDIWLGLWKHISNKVLSTQLTVLEYVMSNLLINVAP